MVLSSSEPALIAAIKLDIDGSGRKGGKPRTRQERNEWLAWKLDRLN